MRISVDKEFWVPIVLCLIATCALTFLIIPATGSAGHSDGGDQCISDEKVMSLNGSRTFTVDGDGVEVTFKNHDTSEDEVNLDVDGTPVSVPEGDIGDPGIDDGTWNSVSITSPLEVRIPGVAGSGPDITNISVEVHDTECDGDDAPTADDDGTVDAGICAENTTQIIDVLDNDGDDNGNNYDKSNITITQITEEPSAGSDTVQIIDDNGVDKLSYTPDPNTTGEVTFEYEAEFPDPESTTDTATVTIDVTDGSCGSLTVKVEGPEGNPVSGATVEPLIGGTPVQQVTGPDGTAPYNVEISDGPVQTQMNESMIINIPDGFATSVDEYRKDVEQASTPSGKKDEPDDHTYQNVSLTKSKLATDPSGTPCSTSTKSIYSDFGNLDVESIKQTDDDGDIHNNNPSTPKTKEVLINNVVSSSTESVGDLTISFADDPGSGLDPNDQPGFYALADCMKGSNPSVCKATSTLMELTDNTDDTELRKLTAQGEGSSVVDNTDTSDITMDSDMGDRVELKTEASTNIGDNSSSHVQAGIDITDITLEVCN